MFKNAIIRYGEQPASEFLAHPHNPRKHPDKQRKLVNASLKRFGWVAPVVVNVTTGYVIDGHERVWQALSAGDDTPVPFVEVQVPTELEAELIAVFDRITYEAEYDSDNLQALLATINTDDEALGALLKEMEEEYIPLSDEPLPDNPPSIDKAGELQVKWNTERGQLWLIPSKHGGEHRLLCGDSTVAEDVGRVMDGGICDMVATDPPYGVSYADKNAYLNAIAPANRIQVPIENDHASKDNVKTLWLNCFERAHAVMKEGAVIYCFMPQGGDQMMMMMMMMMKAGIEPRHEIIWLKNNHVLGRVDYAYKHEPIIYAWKGSGHKFYGDFQTSIIKVAKPHKSELHPTMKPVELLAILIRNSSLRSQTVYDPFGGSGTTMVACEQLGRLCRMIEIEPKYVAVILERMATLGLEPRLA